MYQKIYAKLLLLYAGLPKAFLGLLAKQLEAKVTDESGIEGAITELDTQISIKTLGEEYQKEGDRRVTTAKTEWDSKNPKPADPNNPKPDDKTPTGDEPPAWAKSLITEVQQLRKERVLGTIKEQATAKLKDVPASYWSKRALPEKAEDLDAFIEDVTTDWTNFKQEQINAGLMTAEAPAGSGGATGGGAGKVNEKALEADIDSWATKETKATAKVEK